MLNKLKKTYSEYPRPFWIMMLGMFIDQLGGNIAFPFFALYITDKFNVGFTQVGLMLGAMTTGGIVGGLIGGSLADRFGRKKLILFGLLTSGLYSLVIIFINRFELFFIVAVTIGFLGSLSGPANGAMMADILPEERRASGFGIFRVVFNITVAIGPPVGGFISDYSYNWLFIGDAVTSAITFFIVMRLLPESKPDLSAESEQAKEKKKMGYSRLLKDTDYILLLVSMFLMLAVMLQMLTTLSVFMRDARGFPNKYYGYILSLNAIMVVAMQFWVSRKAEKVPPLFAMVIGAIFSTIGYTLFGFVEGIFMFAAAMAILTIGEMVIDPMSQSIAAKFAPQDMRGRYMAALNLSSRLSNVITPYLAGLLIDNYDPNWIWYACGIVGSVAILGFLYLHFRLQRREAMGAVKAPAETSAS